MKMRRQQKWPSPLRRTWRLEGTEGEAGRMREFGSCGAGDEGDDSVGDEDGGGGGGEERWGQRKQWWRGRMTGDGDEGEGRPL